MELICPSCEARYQIPDGAIGEKGRQVSCMNCGHVWHAQPPLVLGDAVRAPIGAKPLAPAHPSPGSTHTSADSPDYEEMDGRDDRIMPPQSRTEQLAEIRQMLAEVQSDARPTTPEPETLRADTREPVAPIPTAAPVHEEELPPADPLNPDRPVEVKPDPEEDYADPLRNQIEKQAHKKEAVKEPNVDRMKKRHDRRERQHQHAKSVRSGAFLTGFLLIVILAAILAALYLLKPEIVAQMPQTEEAMNEYVEVVDSMSLSVSNTVTAVLDWVVERTERFF